MSPRLALLALAVLCVAWIYRRPLQRILAPAESDYTSSAKLEPEYPRPRADLQPLWKVELELGYGGAAIDGGEVFVLDREPGVGDTLRVLELSSGEERWSFSYPAPGRLEFAGSRSTPVVVDDRIYTCGVFGRVFCIDRETRQPLWSKRLEQDCGGALPDFGWAASPLVHGSLVILPALGPHVGLVALDRASGEIVWKSAPLGRSHSTPVLLELLGRTCIVFLSSNVQGQGLEQAAPSILSAFDPATGEELWRTTTLLTDVPIPPPVRVADDLIFLTGGYSGGSTLLRIREDARGTSFEQVFHIDKGAQLHPPVVHDEHIYLVANENANDPRRLRGHGGLLCLDMRGKELWSTGKDPYFGRGHILLLGRHLLIQDGLSGMIRLALASPRGFTQLATANAFESPPKARRRMWAPMARKRDMLVVRGERELRCLRLGDRGLR